MYDKTRESWEDIWSKVSVEAEQTLLVKILPWPFNFTTLIIGRKK